MFSCGKRTHTKKIAETLECALCKYGWNITGNDDPILVLTSFVIIINIPEEHVKCWVKVHYNSLKFEAPVILWWFYTYRLEQFQERVTVSCAVASLCIFFATEAYAEVPFACDCLPFSSSPPLFWFCANKRQR